MAHALLNKLEHFVHLSKADKSILLEATAARIRKIEGNQEILREGDKPNYINVVLEGWAIRYKEIDDGRRQIVAFFLPGDLCDLNIFILGSLDHSIASITPMTLAEINKQSFEGITEGHPRITKALWWDTLVNSSIQREWALNLGQRTALERIAHLFCELYLRMKAAGLATDGFCPFPVTQIELADATGMTAVHVNRTLQELRAQNLVIVEEEGLTILQPDRLASVAKFTSDYLHLHHDGSHMDAND